LSDKIMELMYGYKAEVRQILRTCHYVFVLISNCRSVRAISVPAYNRTLTKLNISDPLIHGDMLQATLEQFAAFWARHLCPYCVTTFELQHTLKSIWMESTLYLGFREHKQVHVICSHLAVQTNIGTAATLDSSQYKEHVWLAKQQLIFSVVTGGRLATMWGPFAVKFYHCWELSLKTGLVKWIRKWRVSKVEASARNQDTWKNGAKYLLRSTSSGVSRVLHAHVERSQWPPLTEITDLKNQNYFMNCLLSVCLSLYLSAI